LLECQQLPFEATHLTGRVLASFQC
jgi:hypothetical protein